MSTITVVLDTVGAFYLVELWYKMSVPITFVLDTVGLLYFVELGYKLSVHNNLCVRYCGFILFGRVMVQIECPQLRLSSILSVHCIW